MNDTGRQLAFLRELTWSRLLIVAAVLIGCVLLVTAVRAIVRRFAEGAPSHRRLLILRVAPIARLLIWIAGIVVIVPLLVEPTFQDVVAMVAAVSLALAFGLKDFVSSVVAGVVTIVENTYQPGDWIAIDGAYGEVTAIGTRAVHIVTADDTDVTIPHAKLWSSKVANASGGKRSLLCVADFYLDADHDGAAVSRALIETGEASRYRKPDTPVSVVAAEAPWGTHYKIKAYVTDSRDQFDMITDLTLQGKARLRHLGVAFARASYAASGHG